MTSYPDLKLIHIYASTVPVTSHRSVWHETLWLCKENRNIPCLMISQPSASSGTYHYHGLHRIRRYFITFKNWLVVSTHLKNISQNGNLLQVGMKNGEKKHLKPPPRESTSTLKSWMLNSSENRHTSERNIAAKIILSQMLHGTGIFTSISFPFVHVAILHQTCRQICGIHGNICPYVLNVNSLGHFPRLPNTESEEVWRGDPKKTYHPNTIQLRRYDWKTRVIWGL